MPIKKILMALTAYYLSSFFMSAQASDGVGYNELSAQQKYAVDASFLETTPTYPVKKKKYQHANYQRGYNSTPPPHSIKIKNVHELTSYDYQLPRKISTTEKVIIVDPNIHAWGAYTSEGNLIRAGLATAGSSWCSDINRACKTKAGTFRISSLGSGDCVSSKYPINEGGGAPMPYCMYFNGSQGLHGSNQVVEDNISHGCVRLRVSDAKWLRFNFSNVGTKVIIKAY